MTPDYTYASARVKALESQLLSYSQAELLTSAKSPDELYTVLYDTYLASYLKRNTEQDILASLEEQISDTKTLLQTIAPDPAVLDILWIKYDYHNLKAIVKGMRVGLKDEDIVRECYVESILPPETLLAHVRGGTLANYAPELVETLQEAESAQTPELVGETCDRAYFARMRDIAGRSKDTFAKEYVGLLVDMYNLKVFARSAVRETFRARKALVPGGACTLPAEFEPAHLAREYARYGAVDLWKQALTEVLVARNVSAFERVADDMATEWVKRVAIVDFNLADLVRYFHAVKNNAQIISTIAKAKRAGMPEKTLRSILRALYV